MTENCAENPSFYHLPLSEIYFSQHFLQVSETYDDKEAKR